MNGVGTGVTHSSLVHLHASQGLAGGQFCCSIPPVPFSGTIPYSFHVLLVVVIRTMVLAIHCQVQEGPSSVVGSMLSQDMNIGANVKVDKVASLALFAGRYNIALSSIVE